MNYYAIAIFFLIRFLVVRLIFKYRLKFLKGLLYGAAGVLLIWGAFVYYDEFDTNRNLERLENWSEMNKISVDKNKIKLKPFKIEFDQSEWDFLLKKLEMSRYFKPLNEKYSERNEYGFDSDYTQELVEYWKTKFNWKSQVDYLNKFPQFQIQINETTIHFVRVITNKNDDKASIPIMLMDGWPGTFFGFYKMIDYINTEFKHTSFDIIVPTIPGYGYSTPLDRPLDTLDTAQLFDGIMRYSHGESVEYFVHGEDWGSAIATDMAKLFPQRVKALHVSFPIVSLKPNPYLIFYGLVGEYWPSLFLTQEEIANNFTFSLSNTFFTILKKTGYFHLQATRPDTLGHGLTDSPTGLLAYLIEKYSIGTFGFDFVEIKKGNLNPPFTKDELLTIVTYYWMTNTITPSIRYYRTNIEIPFKPWPRSEMRNYKVGNKVPVSIQYFKNEVWSYPFVLLQKTFLNLKQFKIESSGGHFAGFENPKKTADSFIDFVLSS